MQNILTIDYEEWYHGFGLRDNTPGSHPKRVHRLTDRLLDLLAKHHTKATFFVVARLAEEYPHLIKGISDSGHEIGCHGYDHLPLPQLGKSELTESIYKAKRILEDKSGRAVRGFRAPWLKLPRDRNRFFQLLKILDFEYDSSELAVWDPLRNGLKDMVSCQEKYGLHEIAIPCLSLPGMHINICSGISFRIMPLALTRWFIRSLNEYGLPAIIFLHPYEFDSHSPTLPYTGIKTLRRRLFPARTEVKLSQILKFHAFGCAETYLDFYRAEPQKAGA